ncbi:hypothetical protein [Nocardia transvalensis]|uniref:hypothetical protein n=1 Tax=Nocardia transvalensis TaxID=37333 RepID=UPI001895E615|nr:hypothetical protein [Nocardia transvalensis]MBF6333584.1 hypothetical protein [Nocardia transvalensis]
MSRNNIHAHDGPDSSHSQVSPNTRYHNQNARDAAARAAHASVSKQWRRQLAAAAFHRRDQAKLLTMIRSGTTLTAAAAELGLSHQAVYGRANWDTRFGNRLERVLAATCPAGSRCGTPAGARFHGGHCRACRNAKRQTGMS